MGLWKRFYKGMEKAGAYRTASELRRQGFYREADDLIKNINRDE